MLLKGIWLKSKVLSWLKLIKNHLLIDIQDVSLILSWLVDTWPECAEFIAVLLLKLFLADEGLADDRLAPVLD